MNESNKNDHEPKPARNNSMPESQSELTNEQLDQVTGGITFVYGKLGVVYTPQKATGEDDSHK